MFTNTKVQLQLYFIAIFLLEYSIDKINKESNKYKPFWFYAIEQHITVKRFQITQGISIKYYHSQLLRSKITNTKKRIIMN